MKTYSILGSDATLKKTHKNSRERERKHRVVVGYVWTRLNRSGLRCRLWFEDEAIILTLEAWQENTLVNREVRGSWPSKELHEALASFYALATQIKDV